METRTSVPRQWDEVVIDGHPPVTGVIVRVLPETRQALVKAGLSEGLFPWYALRPVRAGEGNSLPYTDSHTEEERDSCT